MGKKPHSLPDSQLVPEGGGDISHEDWLDIQQSVGALGQQVKATEKQKANENKTKGYAKAKTIGKKYG